ncbi:RagB/SusD family nutrient uptake outer membrane protein [Hymenobacter metallicola]|uniref:RagB/SusD family nutrient uptake outer membrane protein n=1 Tax=Hymenobacter metallicola TaxID=2563114 RepID=A0A4Z0Q2L8_9BACT|nr:RagB/SusD family nutrient uptake outer membrane protein [Hymenobacter metallicola]TGE23341.1 RagB/SusD family nutrient uptake outer membrane protein [Hymenobacter metallicola]
MLFRNKITALALLGFLSFAGTSCQDFLEEEPQNALVTDQVFTDLAGANAAIIGTYGTFTSANYYGLRYPVMADLSADNLAHIGTFPSFAEIKNRNIQPSNVEVSNMWAILYQGVNRANNVIEYVPAISSIPEATRNSLVAEARFLRAYFYFDLVRYWGDVPLVLTATKQADASLNVTRTPVAEVYDQIQKDLVAAEAGLPETNLGRATKSAAIALQARLALYRGQWQAASDLSDRIIASKRFTLVPNYRDVFDTENSTEAIFEVNFENTNQSQFAFFFFPTTRGGRNEVSPTGGGSTLPTAYEAGDRRKDASISNGTFLAGGQTIPAGVGIKYTKPGTGEDNYRAIRYAEVLLTSAEAKAQLSKLPQAIIDLNLVRTRAGLAGTTAVTKEELLLAIERERRVELAMEGHRWFDLARTGRAQAVLSVTDARRLLFPIPFRETVNNPNLKQNPGY